MESERLQRLKENYYDDDRNKLDEELAERIRLLLNDPKVDKYCMVDAYYYDFSVIPEAIQKISYLCRDAYLIYGINIDGEMVSKWVDRWDLDSIDPIIDGKVIHKPYDPCKECLIPIIKTELNPALLSTPAPDLLKYF